VADAIVPDVIAALVAWCRIAIPAVLVLLAVLAVGINGEPACADTELPVVEVTGNDVNLRCGPSIDHHDVGQLSRGRHLLEVGRDGEFVRVRVPGGVPVFVFGSLLDWDADEGEQGALRCKVAADDVLMRATPTTRHYPVHDQKLQRGQELVVLGTEETEKGAWLRVVAPAHVHVWIHERYVRPADPAPTAHAIDRAADARLDELTNGRTRLERERVEATRTKVFETRLAALRERVDGGEVGADVEAAARDLAGSTETEALRVRALALAERIVGLREVREEERRRAEAEAAREAAEEARKERERLEEEQRRREAEKEVERRRRERDRGTPAARGVVRVRDGDVLLETSGKPTVELRSSRFRLGDYAGRSVRVWGHRRERANDRDLLEVTSIEIVGD
jgi:hypothetical protein